MKQKKIGTTLYVFDTTAYQITEDTDATVIKIQEECIPAYAKLNQTLVSKFEPINYKLYCVQKPEWADYYDDLEIIIAPTTNGTVTVSPASADMGEEVTITTTPDAGYKLDTLTVMCGDVEVQVTDNKFTMPVESVVVTATFIAQTYAERYFTIESVEDSNTITIRTESEKTFEVSLDDGSTWIEATGTYSTTPSLDQYDRLLVRATGDTFTYTNGNVKESIIVSEKDIKIYGNIMSLLYGSSFANHTSFPEGTIKNFSGLFKDCGDIVDAKHLILPATTLANNCYADMFNGCTSLTTAPALTATTLANNCYADMFNGCTSLTTAPALPATTLTEGCYADMFNGCTSLTTAPALPATTLADSCYYHMFQSCTSLTTAPALPATTLVDNCYTYMFEGCSSLTTAPDLNAATAVRGCYQYMFRDCSSLNYIKCLATNISASGCTTNWVNGVASSGTFYKNASMTSWTTGNNGIPSGWTVEDYTPSV